MTIQELYAKIGGNYEQAQRVMKMDKLIDRYVRKLPNSGAYEALMAAGETMDGAKLFESAHALKGVCANLGLDNLSQAASVLAEEFRPGSPRSMDDAVVQEKVSELKQMYDKAIDGIRAFSSEQ